MSYSFTVRAATKVEAKEKVAAELAKVVETQPIHARDQQQAEAAASAFVDLLPEDDTQDVTVSVHGSIGWYGSLDDKTISAGVGINVGFAAKVAPKA